MEQTPLINSYSVYWIAFIALFILSIVVQRVLNSRFEKYSQIGNSANMSGAEVAAQMLRDNKITNVKVECVEGRLTDHFNPATMTVNLSKSVYYGRSIAAAAVAAHECGHVVQHARGYAPLRLRSALVPVVSFASNFVQWVILAGLVFINAFPSLIWIGIGLFALTTLFSIITLPVEIDASRRAIAWLELSHIANYETRPLAIDALRWAAYTYVIAAVSSIATLLYYIGIARNRN